MALGSIEFHKVTIRFGSETLLNQVDLTIAPGEKVVVIGPSGQGKSVLLKLIAGIILPTSGEIRVDGKDLHRLTEVERHQLMRRMGMLFQKNALFDSLTVGENIAFPLREAGRLEEAEIQKKVVHFLEAVGIGHARDLYPDEISGGMQKRLGIARALALDPEIILYDDPTAGLDPITSRKIIELILDLQRGAKATLVAITNDMARAYQMADRIIMVVDHGVIVTGNVQQTKQHTDPRVHQFIRGALQGPLTEVEA
ncbi:MAG: ABC transporter ATP-binding protein [Bdellovibrionales bacterium]